MNTERIKLLQEYLEENPEDPFNRHALAMEYDGENPDECLRLLALNLREHPNYLPTYFKAAHLYWEKENWEDAAKTFRKGIHLAEEQSDRKALTELKAAFLNFEFDME